MSLTATSERLDKAKDLDGIAWPACRCMTWTGETWISLRAACFDAVLSASRGRRFPFDALGSQMLWFMVNGCAAEITPSSFVVPYIISGRSDHYDLSLAPGIISFLLGGTALPETGHVIRQIQLVANRTFDGFPPWDESSLGARYVRIDDVGGRIVFRIRGSVAALAAIGPEVPVVDPVRFLVLERTCPHCGHIPERYRVLRDGSLVCLACGRSVPAP